MRLLRHAVVRPGSPRLLHPSARSESRTIPGTRTSYAPEISIRTACPTSPSRPLNGFVVLKGEGGGLFSTPVIVGPGDNAEFLVVADFDGDGLPDVATSRSYSGNLVTVYLADGTGGFRPPRPFVAGNLDNRAMAAADFDGDGHVDLALASHQYGRVIFLHGLGNGDFVSLGFVPVGQKPTQLAAADLDGDGLEDLVVADEGSFGVGLVHVFHSQPNTMPSLTASIEIPTGALSVAVGDVDGGPVDLVVGAYSLSVLHGHGDGSFDSPVSSDTSGYLVDLALVDLDGDGHLDVGAANQGGLLEVFRNDGSGAFLEPVRRPTGDEAESVAAGDFDGDGRPDLALAAGYDDYVFVFPTTAGGDPVEAPWYEYGDIARGLQLVDMDLNGTLDAVTSSWWSRDVAIVPGLGDGTFGPRHAFTDDQPLGAMAIGDLDGDNLPDVVASTGRLRADATCS